MRFMTTPSTTRTADVKSRLGLRRTFSKSSSSKGATTPISTSAR